MMAHDDHTFPSSSGVSAFRGLAQDVVSKLHAQRTGNHANQAIPFACLRLEKRLLSKNSFSPGEALDELRSVRLNDETIIDHCIPDAARMIGKRWVDNELGFAEVTIASARSQNLLNEVEFLGSDLPLGPHVPHDFLVVACEQEQHTLGCFVISAQLRRRGVMVDTLCAEPASLIKARILSGNYGAILFSCSRSQDLETISQIVIDSKSRMSAPPVFALGGIVLDLFRSVKELTGVDLTTCDVDRVLDYCEQRSIHPLKQAAR